MWDALQRTHRRSLLCFILADAEHFSLPLSLGIVKSQWRDSWVSSRALRERTVPNQVRRELDLISDYLAQVRLLTFHAYSTHVFY